MHSELSRTEQLRATPYQGLRRCAHWVLGLFREQEAPSIRDYEAYRSWQSKHNPGVTFLGGDGLHYIATVHNTAEEADELTAWLIALK